MNSKRCLLILFLCGIPIVAFASVSPSLAVTSTRGDTDLDAELALVLSRATNSTAMQFDLTFNPLRAERLPPVWSELLSHHLVRTHELKPGVWRTLIYSPSNALLRPNMAVASLPFHIPTTERYGSGPVTPSEFVLARPDGIAALPVSIGSGRVFISQISPPDPDGSVGLFFPVAKAASYVLFASTNLTAWTRIATNAAIGGIVDFVDIAAARDPYRFYFLSELSVAFPPASPQLSGIEGIGSASGARGSVLRLPAPLGERYQLEASADLKTWIVVKDVTNSTGSIEVAVPNLPDPRQRFFRVMPKSVGPGSE